jgi:hypothetical protein
MQEETNEVLRWTTRESRAVSGRVCGKEPPGDREQIKADNRPRTKKKEWKNTNGHRSWQR